MINKSRLVFRFRGRNTVATVPSCLVFLFYSSCVCVCVFVCVCVCCRGRPVLSRVCVRERESVCVVNPPPPFQPVPNLVSCSNSRPVAFVLLFVYDICLVDCCVSSRSIRSRVCIRVPQLMCVCVCVRVRVHNTVLSSRPPFRLIFCVCVWCVWLIVVCTNICIRLGRPRSCCDRCCLGWRD